MLGGGFVLAKLRIRSRWVVGFRVSYRSTTCISFVETDSYAYLCPQDALTKFVGDVFPVFDAGSLDKGFGAVTAANS